MAILKFRVYFEEDDSVYRDVTIKHTQTFKDLHFAILTSYEFDNKHQATFFRSNDLWHRGREISFVKYDKQYVAPPLLMGETTIASEIKDTNQRFIYLYDFLKNWTFQVALIAVTKEENAKAVYPLISRKEGIGPPQYGTKSLLGEKFADIEEKYDLKEVSTDDGFTTDSDGEATEEEGHAEETGDEF